MPDLDLMQIMSLPLGGIILYFCIKVLWPRITAATDAAVTNDRANSGLVDRLIAERDKANARADAAEAKSDSLFAELADVKSQLRVMGYQLNALQESNLYLKKRLNELIGGESETYD